MEQGHTGTTDGTAGGLPPAVAAALERLESLDGLPTSAHVAAFDDVQRRLHDALADIDDAPAAVGGQPPQPQSPRQPQPRLHGPASAGHRGERGGTRGSSR